jgi:TPP-dependent pyruvate/acetoin dehydrogenase alpha subunit
MNGEISRAIDEAIEWADNSPYPDPSELLDGVYAPEK